MEIRVENLYLTIGKKKILSDINLVFSSGKVYGIVGNNGSGKTMLLKCICGFVKPTSGCVKVDGKTIGKECDFIQNAGVIIEKPEFISFYSGYKNLSILSDYSGKKNDRIIRETLEICGLDPDLKIPVRKYSLGMCQRLGIAQALLENPEILILDEPFNGLDKNGVRDIRELLKKKKNEGKLIILVSHNSLDIDLLSDEVISIDDGIIME